MTTKPIMIKRVYDPPAPSDGTRFLVDRIWPRGLKKEQLEVEAWLKEVAPTGKLRNWFNHDPAKWPEFKRRYTEELEARPQTWEPLLKAIRESTVTLLYAAKDRKHNNAVALKCFLESKAKKSDSPGRRPRRVTPAAARGLTRVSSR